MKSCASMPPTGDRGQRYEVRYQDEKGVEHVLGWADTAASVRQLRKAIDAHPAWSKPRVIDRKPEQGA